VTGSDVRSLVVAGELDEAVRRALALRVRHVIEQFDYDTLDEHAARASDFLQRWVPALDPGERLHAASWANAQFVTALVHLEGAYGIGARLLLEAQQATAAELAATMRDLAALADSPDSETPPTVAQRLSGYAAQVDELDFMPY
jgi:hypothetical protein